MQRNANNPKALVDVLNRYMTTKSRINAVEMASLMKHVVVSVFSKFGISKTDFAQQVLGEIIRSAMSKKNGISRQGEREVLEALKKEWASTPNSPDIFSVPESSSMPPDIKGVYFKYISPFLKNEITRFVESQKTPQDYRRLSLSTNLINKELKSVVKQLTRYTGSDFSGEYIPDNSLLRSAHNRLMLDDILDKELQNSPIARYVSKEELKQFLQMKESGMSVKRFNDFIVDLISGLEQTERSLIANGVSRREIKALMKFSGNKNLDSIYDMILPLYDGATPTMRAKLKEIISNLTWQQWLAGAGASMGTAVLAKYIKDNADKSSKDLLQMLEEKEVAPPKKAGRQMYETDPVDPEDAKDRTMNETDPEPEPDKTPNMASKAETINKLESIIGETKHSFAQPLNFNIPSTDEFVQRQRMNTFNQSISKGVKTGRFQR